MYPVGNRLPRPRRAMSRVLTWQTIPMYDDLLGTENGL
jgi:hypothetical protein